jgi:hypothetical protein
MAWSIDTLADQLIGELNQDRNASGGTVPDRLTNIVREDLRALCKTEEWIFRRREGSLSIAADATEAELPADFDKIDSAYLKDRDEPGWLRFTDNAVEALEQESCWQATDTAHPYLAVIVRDFADPDALAWKVKLIPKSDAAYTKPFFYYTLCPIDLPTTGYGGGETDPHPDYKAASDLIVMPEEFHEGWHLRAAATAHNTFGDKDRAKDYWARYRAWVQRAREEFKEKIANQPARVRDAHGDVQALPGVGVAASPRFQGRSVM